MRSAITISVVPEVRQGPFVFQEGVETGCRMAAELGFDAVELFPESAEGLASAGLERLLAEHGLRLAAVGTGAGWVRHGLHLCHPDAGIRTKAREFIGGLVKVAAGMNAPVIVGSMQGRSDGTVTRETALEMLADSLHDLSSLAARHGQVLLYEPLNRYETNLLNRQEEAAGFLGERGIRHVRLLCDLFHMNIEEADLASSLVGCGELVGHVHWADSNRRAVGYGHTDVRPIVAGLKGIGYQGYLSAEVFPLPDPGAAARRSIESFRQFTKG